MNRIDAVFAGLKQNRRKALIPFITTGFPALDSTVAIMHTLVKAGANIIELGVPFSDPMADGPVIQKAGEKALANGMNVAGVLAAVAEFRVTDSNTPLVLMGYLNPIEVFGYEAFANAAAEAGVDGVLIVDCPPEEAAELNTLFAQRDIAVIYLLAPTSSTRRIAMVAEQAKGYVYYVSLKGVTGSSQLDIASVEQKLVQIREHISLPLGVGFGIKDATSAAAIARVADAAVVGTALIEVLDEHAGDQDALHAAAAELISGMRQAMDAAS